MSERSRQREPLFTPDEMAAADARAPGLGVPGLGLMRRAAWAVAQAALPFGPCRTIVLCGSGGNGGDGWGAAAILARRGWPVAVAEWAAPVAGSDAAVLRAEWRGPVVPFTAAEVGRAALVIDAVFGAGLSRDVPEAVAAVLAAARQILAVDVPSGLDGATGQGRGRVAGGGADGDVCCAQAWACVGAGAGAVREGGVRGYRDAGGGAAGGAVLAEYAGAVGCAAAGECKS